MNLRNALIAIAALVVLVAAGFWLDRPDEARAELLVQPTSGPFRVTVTATGELRAKNSVSIYGPSRARQARIYDMKILQLVPEGTVVTKGQFVAELDKSELNSNIQTAQIDLQKAQSLYTQTSLDTALTLSQARDELVNLQYAMEEAKLRKEQAAYEPPSVQRQEDINFEKAERSFAQAKKNYVTQVNQAIAKMQEVGAELSKNQKQHDDLVSIANEFTVMAPDNGMVIYDREWDGTKKRIGSTVSSWNPVVATLPDLTVMQSITYVNEVDIQKVKAGQTVSIALDADADKQLTGFVESVANIGEQRPNSDAKVFEVAIVINEKDSTLRPAMTTSNTIVVSDVPEALYIPLECVHTADDVTFVYVKDGAQTRRQEVRLGMLNENEVIVEAGLTTEDRLLLSAPDGGETLDLDRLEGGGA
ncbi:MAG: HlyD family efflux transporter periplasmic adaptor subunit [Rhodothermales bacterium]